MKASCSVDGCVRKAQARTLCVNHYKVMKRRGTLPPLLPRPSELERLWARVEVVPGCCWTWLGGTNRQGYGYFLRADGRAQVVHRFVWELLVGPVPDGLQLDHLCRTIRCVNPDHLEPVTCAENLRRGYGVCALNARKKTCIRGHNDWYQRSTGGRLCRACARERKAAA